MVLFFLLLFICSMVAIFSFTGCQQHRVNAQRSNAHVQTMRSEPTVHQLTVYLKSDGTMTLNGMPVTLTTFDQQLHDILAARKGNSGMMILRASKHTQVKQIIKVIDIARNHGIDMIGFGTQPNEPQAQGE